MKDNYMNDSDGDKDRIAISGSVIDGVKKRIVGTRRRMEELGSAISIRKNGDAWQLIELSRNRILKAQADFEADVKARRVAHTVTSRRVVQFLAQASNALDSAIEGMEDGEVTKDDLADVSASVQRALRGVREVLSNAVVNADAAPAKDPAEKFLAEAAHPPISRDPEDHRKAAEEQQRRDESQKRHYDQIGELFRGNHVHQTKLKDARTYDEEFVLVKLPVYPLMSKPVGADQFRQAGLKVGGRAGFYIQLENQVLLGMNTRVLKDEGHKLDRRVVEIIRIISQKRGEVFHVVGSDAHDIRGSGRQAGVNGSLSPGFVYFWLMPESQISRINRVLDRKSGSFLVEDWGIALGPVPAKFKDNDGNEVEDERPIMDKIKDDRTKRSDNVDRLRRLRLSRASTEADKK